jgi:hypothetical protein
MTNLRRVAVAALSAILLVALCVSVSSRTRARSAPDSLAANDVGSLTRIVKAPATPNDVSIVKLPRKIHNPRRPASLQRTREIEAVGDYNSGDKFAFSKLLVGDGDHTVNGIAWSCNDGALSYLECTYATGETMFRGIHPEGKEMLQEIIFKPGEQLVAITVTSSANDVTAITSVETTVTKYPSSCKAQGTPHRFAVSKGFQFLGFFGSTEKDKFLSLGVEELPNMRSSNPADAAGVVCSMHTARLGQTDLLGTPASGKLEPFTSFSDLKPGALVRISAIQLHYDQKAVYGIDVTYNSGERSVFGQSGPPGSKSVTVRIAPDEYVVGFEMLAGSFISGIPTVLLSTRDVTIRHGSTSGTDHTLKVPTGYEMIGIYGSSSESGIQGLGLIYGKNLDPSEMEKEAAETQVSGLKFNPQQSVIIQSNAIGGSAGDHFNMLQAFKHDRSYRISKITVAYGPALTGLICFYNSGLVLETGTLKGQGIQQFTLSLEADEYLTGMQLYAHADIHSISLLYTSGRIVPLPMASQLGNRLELRAPFGDEIIGFFGRSAHAIDSLGIIYGHVRKSGVDPVQTMEVMVNSTNVQPSAPVDGATGDVANRFQTSPRLRAAQRSRVRLSQLDLLYTGNVMTGIRTRLSTGKTATVVFKSVQAPPAYVFSTPATKWHNFEMASGEHVTALGVSSGLHTNIEKIKTNKRTIVAKNSLAKLEWLTVPDANKCEIIGVQGVGQTTVTGSRPGGRPLLGKSKGRLEDSNQHPEMLLGLKLKTGKGIMPAIAKGIAKIFNAPKIAANNLVKLVKNANSGKDAEAIAKSIHHTLAQKSANIAGAKSLAAQYACHAQEAPAPPPEFVYHKTSDLKYSGPVKSNVLALARLAKQDSFDFSSKWKQGVSLAVDRVYIKYKGQFMSGIKFAYSNSATVSIRAPHKYLRGVPAEKTASLKLETGEFISDVVTRQFKGQIAITKIVTNLRTWATPLDRSVLLHNKETLRVKDYQNCEVLGFTGKVMGTPIFESTSDPADAERLEGVTTQMLARRRLIKRPAPPPPRRRVLPKPSAVAKIIKNKINLPKPSKGIKINKIIAPAMPKAPTPPPELLLPGFTELGIVYGCLKDGKGPAKAPVATTKAVQAQKPFSPLAGFKIKQDSQQLWEMMYGTSMPQKQSFAPAITPGLHYKISRMDFKYQGSVLVGITMYYTNGRYFSVAAPAPAKVNGVAWTLPQEQEQTVVVSPQDALVGLDLVRDNQVSISRVVTKTGSVAIRAAKPRKSLSVPPKHLRAGAGNCAIVGLQGSTFGKPVIQEDSKSAKQRKQAGNKLESVTPAGTEELALIDAMVQSREKAVENAMKRFTIPDTLPLPEARLNGFASLSVLVACE